jgi:hypothetical protein
MSQGAGGEGRNLGSPDEEPDASEGKRTPGVDGAGEGSGSGGGTPQRPTSANEAFSPPGKGSGKGPGEGAGEGSGGGGITPV